LGCGRSAYSHVAEPTYWNNSPADIPGIDNLNKIGQNLYNMEIYIYAHIHNNSSYFLLNQTFEVGIK
jgi:hypothetical protein